MRWSKLARGGFVAVALCCFGLPQAEAVEIFDGPSLATHMNDGLITQVRGGGRGGGGGMRRGGGGMHRCGMHGGMARAGGAHRGMHGGAGRYAGANRNVNRNVNRNTNVNRAAYGYRGGAYRGGAYGYRGGAYRGGYYGNWARPGWYGWRPGGAIAAGAAIGFVSAATAAAWAGPARGARPVLVLYRPQPAAGVLGRLPVGLSRSFGWLNALSVKGDRRSTRPETGAA